MVILTRTDIRLLRRLASSGGTCSDLLEISNQIGVHVRTVSLCVQRLEIEGILKVEKNGKGKPIQIQLMPGCAVIPLNRETLQGGLYGSDL